MLIKKNSLSYRRHNPLGVFSQLQETEIIIEYKKAEVIII